MIESPCKNCMKRTANCHGKCGEYKVYQICNNKKRKIIDKEKDEQRFMNKVFYRRILQSKMLQAKYTARCGIPK